MEAEFSRLRSRQVDPFGEKVVEQVKLFTEFLKGIVSNADISSSSAGQQLIEFRSAEPAEKPEDRQSINVEDQTEFAFMRDEVRVVRGNWDGY